jgi:hypothetical protein
MTARPGSPRFSGPFKSFSVSKFTNRETGADSRLLVYSQGSRAKVVKYLWLKFLWDELTKKEFELFLILPETLNSQIKVAVLRSLLIQGKKVTRERLNKALAFMGEEQLTRESYLGYKRIDVEIYDFTRSLPRVPKFSGWIKSSSAVGSKRKSRGPSFLEPLTIIENDYEDVEFDWYSLLTVGGLVILEFPVDLKSP